MGSEIAETINMNVNSNVIPFVIGDFNIDLSLTFNMSPEHYFPVKSHVTNFAKVSLNIQMNCINMFCQI